MNTGPPSKSLTISCLLIRHCSLWMWFELGTFRVQYFAASFTRHVPILESKRKNTDMTVWTPQGEILINQSHNFRRDTESECNIGFSISRHPIWAWPVVFCFYDQTFSQPFCCFFFPSGVFLCRSISAKYCSTFNPFPSPSALIITRCSFVRCLMFDVCLSILSKVKINFTNKNQANPSSKTFIAIQEGTEASVA